jgi:hypothetical protein
MDGERLGGQPAGEQRRGVIVRLGRGRAGGQPIWPGGASDSSVFSHTGRNHGSGGASGGGSSQAFSR